MGTHKWWHALTLGLCPNRYVTYEFEFKGNLVKAGMQIKLKNDYRTYTFNRLVHDSSLGKTWMIVSCKTGTYAKCISRIIKIVGIKKSYARKAKI